ncbi:MAG: hypothetical protein HOI96_11445 [Rhodospirillaceae bacterium]|nr:hypothetical protein [Rhodospirillaceae bacterium]
MSAVNRRFETSFAPVTPDRHAQLSKAFLAQEKLDGLANPPSNTPESLPPPLLSGRLVDRARAAHECMLAAAAEDGTI